MGDCYLNGSFPVVDFSNGGVFTGIIAAADTALGMLDARTRIIPGTGPSPATTICASGERCLRRSTSA